LSFRAFDVNVASTRRTGSTESVNDLFQLENRSFRHIGWDPGLDAKTRTFQRPGRETALFSFIFLGEGTERVLISVRG
jgi:hypothetical protein